MHTGAQRTLSLVLGFVLLCTLSVAAGNAAAPFPQHRVAPSHRSAAHGQPKFRPARGAAAQDAARVGALAGKECHGKATMPRSDHESVVLCSNGKAFVVATPAPHQAGAPATECSLAGASPLPACFDQ